MSVKRTELFASLGHAGPGWEHSTKSPTAIYSGSTAMGVVTWDGWGWVSLWIDLGGGPTAEARHDRADLAIAHVEGLEAAVRARRAAESGRDV